MIDWTIVGAIGEALGAAGVIMTLLYVARQIRMSTLAVHSSVEKDLRRMAFDHAMEMARSPHLCKQALAALKNERLMEYASAVGDDLGIDAVEMMTLTSYYVAGLQIYESRFRQYELGVIDETAFDEFGRPDSWYGTAAFRALWPITQRSLAPDFVEFLEARIQMNQARAGATLGD